MFCGAEGNRTNNSEKLPEGFQRAEYLLDHGMLDLVTPRTKIRSELIKIIRMLLGLSPVVVGDLQSLRQITHRKKPKKTLMTSKSSDKILKRMMDLHPKVIDLTLDRVFGLLDALNSPHKKLPAVVHIAGTNGKGSTLSMIRAGLESSGRSVHTYTSPHLIRFNERIRLANKLITETELSQLLDESYKAKAGKEINYFEINTCASMLAMRLNNADYTLLEVGLGGRLDATNVVEKPASSHYTNIF